MKYNKNETDVTEQELGKLLTEANSNKKYILIHAIVRFILCTIFFIGIMGYIKRGGRVSDYGTISFAIRSIIILVLCIIYIVIPLTHWKDYIGFYEKGIKFNNKKIKFEKSETIQFRKQSLSILGRYLTLETSKKNINVTYINTPKKQYQRAYMNYVEVNK